LKKVISVVGARPNFVKISPIHKAFQKYKSEINHLICHTGQHFDKNMSKVFFEELQMPEPDFYLGISGGSHAQQTARIMIEFEKVLLDEKPDLVIVPGDVNSTLASSLVASKLHIPIAHVESGLRSFDRMMPEEINRILTDVIADMLFVTEESAIKNLSNEGIDSDKVFFTGNVMIDSLVNYLPEIEKSTVLNNNNLEQGNYILATFHRPSNVDNPDNLVKIITTLNDLSKHCQVLFPAHPRTRKKMNELGLIDKVEATVKITEPIGYIDFLSLTKNAKLVITDSGGIQEETTFMGVQCITVRNSTERPVTVSLGTNQIVGEDFKKLFSVANEILRGRIKKGKIPDLWDGKAAERIAEIVANTLLNN